MPSLKHSVLPWDLGITIPALLLSNHHVPAAGGIAELIIFGRHIGRSANALAEKPTHGLLSRRAEDGLGPWGVHHQALLSKNFEQGERKPVWRHSFTSRLLSSTKKKKKRRQRVSSGRNTGDHRCICPPAPAVLSVCLPLASFIRSWL